MFKALNMKIKAHNKVKEDGFWLTLFEQLDTLCKLQLIVCPDSLTHFDESIVTDYFRGLRRMYELLSHGATFKNFETIERFHLVECARRWIKNLDNDDVLLDIKSIARNDVHRWQERFIISVNWDEMTDVISEIRSLNDMEDSSIKVLFSSWQSMSEFNFEKQYQFELKSYGETIIKCYYDYLEKLRKAMLGELPDKHEDLSPNQSTILVKAIENTFKHEGISSDEALSKTIQFLLSDFADKIPSHKISSLMYAALARRAVNGQKSLKGSIFNDVKTISNLLPYCDALFIDKECASLLNEGPLKSRIKYDTNIYSLNNKAEFLAYLQKLKDEMSEDHLQYVYQVYGEEGVKPFTQLYLKNEE